MNIRVRFLGGAQTVTGSKFLLEFDDFRVLVDCGLFQGIRELRRRNWDPLPAEARKIDAVVITHAHIDHTGYLPKLFKEGYRGPVYCTTATKDLMEIMLLDSAKLQEEEAEYAFKKGYSKHEKPEPLYTTEDVNVALPYLEGYKYNQRIRISDRIEINYLDAGHILGSAITEMYVTGDNMRKKIVFSGDIGRYDKPILRNPTTVKTADILFVESTYGNKVNPPVSPKEMIADIVNNAFERRGCLLIPAFAVGRTQTLIYYLKQLIEERKIPSVPIFIDSPMGINATVLYKRHTEFHMLQGGRHGEPESLFDFPNLQYYRDQTDSVALNNIKSHAIIISASGMCNGGRVLHHLYHRLPRENDTVLFVGYQAEGTRGRAILEGEPHVKIFGEEVPVKCTVKHINGLSAHADKDELLRWLQGFKNSPKNTFIVHGEQENAQAFSETIRSEFGWNTTVPYYLESFDLFRGI